MFTDWVDELSYMLKLIGVTQIEDFHRGEGVFILTITAPGRVKNSDIANLISRYIPSIFTTTGDHAEIVVSEYTGQLRQVNFNRIIEGQING